MPASTTPAPGDGQEPPARPGASGRPRRIVVDPDGPLLVEGPVEVVRADGTVERSDRFVVAVCTCRRTRTAPWCDTSHRCHERPARRRTPSARADQENPERSRDDDHRA